MNWLEGILLGFIQGLTEFLPISSSGHLIIAQDLMGITTPGLAFEVLLNFSSFLAILLVTWKDVVQIIKDFFVYIRYRNPEHKFNFQMGLYIIIGSIPAAVLGLLFEDTINVYLHSITTVAIMLLITGFALYWIRSKDGLRSAEKMNSRDAWTVGLAQAIALIPGISRSGSTLVAGLAMGLTKETALRYTFLLALPVGLGSMLLSLNDLVDNPMVTGNAFDYALTFVVTFFSTLLGIRLLMNVVRRHSLIYFSWYCWIAGAILLFI